MNVVLVFLNRNDYRFRYTIVNCLTVRMDKILQEPEAALECRGTVAERALEGMPEGEMRMCQRYNANPKQTFTDSLAFAKVCCDGKIDNNGSETLKGMKWIKFNIVCFRFTGDQQRPDNKCGEKNYNDKKIDEEREYPRSKACERNLP